MHTKYPFHFFLDLVFGFLESNEIGSIVNMKRKLWIETYLLL